ncbi:13795_t:CDS:2 [Rhizophagus irregularis]|nr:13795_t:CDS:2 [Rhizophagus irregularis]
MNIDRDKAESIIFNVILSHSSEDSRDILKKQGIDDLFAGAYRPPSFNYINFWRHLDLQLLKDMINLRNVKESNIDIIINELLKLFINKNTKFLSLFIPYNFKYQLHKFKIFEKSLIKKADTIQHLRINRNPGDEFLSYFVNLSSLKIGRYDYAVKKTNWCHLERVSSPGLKVLIANIESHQNLDRMIKTKNGHLHEITLTHSGIVSDADYNRRLIRAIYQNCPNLRYLSMPIKEQNIPEFERLLINCQNLNGLIFEYEMHFKYKSLFEILIRSSPISLYKFKIYFNRKFGPKFKLLKSFFDNWKDRHPMILQINMFNFDDYREMDKLKELVKKYEVKGIVQRCDFNCFHDYDEFDWIRKKTDVY